jgi:hypothetical protein
MNGEKVKKLSHLTNMGGPGLMASRPQKILGQNFSYENSLTKYN